MLLSHANESAAPGRYDVNLSFVGVAPPRPARTPARDSPTRTARAVDECHTAIYQNATVAVELWMVNDSTAAARASPPRPAVGGRPAPPSATTAAASASLGASSRMPCGDTTNRYLASPSAGKSANTTVADLGMEHGARGAEPTSDANERTPPSRGDHQRRRAEHGTPRTPT